MRLLLAILHHVPTPTPTLALSPARSLKQWGLIEIAIDTSKEYLATRENWYPTKETERRPFLISKITLARYQSKPSPEAGLVLYEQIFAQFTEQIGPTPSYTLVVGLESAQLWRKQGEIAVAMDLGIQILQTVSGASQASDKELDSCLKSSCKTGLAGAVTTLDRRVRIAPGQRKLWNRCLNIVSHSSVWQK